MSAGIDQCVCGFNLAANNNGIQHHCQTPPPNPSVSIDKDELREELRQGSEARHVINRQTPDGKEAVEMIPLEWAIEVFSAQITTILDNLEAQAVELSTVVEKEPRLYGFAPTKAIPLSAIHQLRQELNGEKV